MNTCVSELIRGINLTGEIERDSRDIFLHYGHKQNLEHSDKVAQESRRIAKLYGLDEESAIIAGLLHDISEIIPHDHMVDWATELGINGLEEELSYPIILHQRLSKELAKEIFKVEDINILNAIECHTTLKASPSPYDMLLFVSDKIVWDKQYNDKFIDDIFLGLDKSLEQACLAYLRYLIDNRQNLKVLHPWTLNGYKYLTEICKDKDY